MTALSDRIEREPDYRQHCLNCSTMRRMTLEPDGRTMWCEPVRDDTFDRAAAMLGLRGHHRYGCGQRFDIFTGESVKSV